MDDHESEEFQSVQQENLVQQEKPWFVYLLATVQGPSRTYVGATVDVDRRLQQHNGALSGGARATSRVPGGWYRVCYIRGFESKREALRFEWWWKRRSAKLKGSPLERRQAAMEAMLGESEQGPNGLEVTFE